jgi:phosphoserine aminotransferase
MVQESGCWSREVPQSQQGILLNQNTNSLIFQVVSLNNNFTTVPPINEWKLSKDAAYLYYCANETIHGVEVTDLAGLPEGINLVADISSNILSRPIDIAKVSPEFKNQFI